MQSTLEIAVAVPATDTNDVHVPAIIPRILFIEDLAPIIGKSLTTIRICSSSRLYKHLIPRPFKLTGSRRLCWNEQDVALWIQSQSKFEIPPPPDPAPKLQAKPRRGRPPKSEQLARKGL